MISSCFAADGFFIANGKLYDANNQLFVMRGVNHAHTWFRDKTATALTDIKSLGANTVRIVLSSGDVYTENSASDVASVISQCKTAKLICVLEVHDTTGWGEAGAAVPLSEAVSYWISIKSTLDGEEKYILINIGNEPFGNNNVGNWKTATKDAIAALRTAGFKHTLIVDAPNWGQDWSNTMQSAASEIFNSDVDKNTILSVHMYEIYKTPSDVSNYLTPYLDNNLPVIVGEYGHYHNSQDVDEDAIMSFSLANNIGILAWSWSGNSGGVEYLDLANNWNKNSLSTWGQRTFTGTNGISTTAVEASVYSGTIVY